MLQDNHIDTPCCDREFQAIDLYKGRNVTVSYPGSQYELNGKVTSVLTLAERHDVEIQAKLPNGDIGIIRIMTRKVNR